MKSWMMDEWKNIEGWMDGRINDGWMEGCINRRMEEINKQKYDVWIEIFVSDCYFVTLKKALHQYM